MGKHKSFGIVIFSLILMLSSFSLACAAPPVQTTINPSQGITIDYPKIDTIKQFSDYTFNFHAYNTSNGVLKTSATTSCQLHIYNDVGDHLYDKPVPYVTADGEWEVLIKGGNFSYAGAYSIITQCNTSSLGGFVSFPLTVTSDGKADNLGLYIIMFLIAYGILIIGITTRNIPTTIIGGFITMALGIFCINSGINGTKTQLTYIVSILTAVIGGFWSLKAAFELIEEGDL